MYHFPNGTALTRVNYQCPACGPVGEDDGSGLVSLASMSTDAVLGGHIRATISSSGPADSLLTVRAVGLLESPFRDRTMMSDIVRELVQPGGARECELTLTVPDDLTPGSYACAVLVVANGSAFVFRRMVQITNALGADRSVSVAPPRSEAVANGAGLSGLSVEGRYGEPASRVGSSSALGSEE